MIKKSALAAANSIYLIGIGGIGMSALARYYRAHGCRVAGSDATASPITAALRHEGIDVKIGHTTGNVINLEANAGLVVYNRAIPADNPEFAAARKLGVRAIPYAEALGGLTEEYLAIAITGSHGKSTTTALAGLALVAGGLDPTVLVGTNLKEFGGKNIRLGKSRYLVLEADDFGGAFWAYSPLVSIVTNIDREHLDFYKDLAGVKRAFLKFIAGTVSGGALILNRDDENLYSLRSKIIVIAKRKKLRVVWYSIGVPHGKLNSTAQKIKKIVKLSGDHNLSNAMAVYELGKLLKIHEKKTLAVIGRYNGSWRRMEYRGKAKLGDVTVKVFDDYAHHPTEIRATLQAFREKFPRSPLVCVFQPHQAKRLKALFKEFTDAFTGADILMLLPSYNPTGRDDTDPRFTSERLAAAITKKYRYKAVYYLANPRHIKKSLTRIIPKNSVIIMMGAGDIVQFTDSMVK